MQTEEVLCRKRRRVPARAQYHESKLQNRPTAPRVEGSCMDYGISILDGAISPERDRPWTGRASVLEAEDVVRGVARVPAERRRNHPGRHRMLRPSLRERRIHGPSARAR